MNEEEKKVIEDMLHGEEATGAEQEHSGAGRIPFYRYLAYGRPGYKLHFLPYGRKFHDE